MMNIKAFKTASVFTLLIFTGNYPVVSAETLKGDNQHARTWNAFADNTMKLHKKLVENKEIEVKSSIGGYHGDGEFYREDKHYDAETDNLISIIRWERENPKQMHTIEVNVRDDKGRVVRDYIAAYLPTFRNAPTQTLISFHIYNGDLHAFRSFDASGDWILDRCEGELDGVEVNLLLDEDEIYAALEGRSNAMEAKDYKACFKGMPQTVGKYLTPQ